MHVKRMGNISYKEALRNARAVRANKSFRTGMLAGHVCRIISRYCSAWFVTKGIVPNQVTLLMIIFGIIGSIFFALPYLWAKIVGYLLWFLWFTMDVSDGEVAKSTGNFSKYGTEMDYMAHLIDHPLMNLAIWLTFLEMNIINLVLLSAIFIVAISAELVTRSLITFRHYDRKLNMSGTTSIPKEGSWFKYFWGNTWLYPTMIVCFSWLIVVDYGLDNGFSFWLFIIWLSGYLIMFIRDVIKILGRCYRGDNGLS